MSPDKVLIQYAVGLPGIWSGAYMATWGPRVPGQPHSSAWLSQSVDVLVLMYDMNNSSPTFVPILRMPIGVSVYYGFVRASMSSWGHDCLDP